MTTEPNIVLGDGYNTLFDLRRDACVTQAAGRAPTVGQPLQQTTIRQIQTDTELAKELGVTPRSR